MHIFTLKPTKLIYLYKTKETHLKFCKYKKKIKNELEEIH